MADKFVVIPHDKYTKLTSQVSTQYGMGDKVTTPPPGLPSSDAIVRQEEIISNALNRKGDMGNDRKAYQSSEAIDSEDDTHSEDSVGESKSEEIKPWKEVWQRV